jgi:release factor glutamine methyltransferase
VGLGDEFGPGQREKFLSSVARRMAGEPVSKIIGRRSFWDWDFFVNGRVLDPRQDSETVVEAVSRDFRGPRETSGKIRVLDLGVGSGCLLLSVLKILPGAVGVGLDIDPGALAVAEENARALAVENVEFRLGDWNRELEGEFDVVISNPPYIETEAIAGLEEEVRLYDPWIALDGGNDGLDCFRAIAGGITRNLARGARMYIEVGYGQAAAVTDLFGENNFKLLRIERDLGGVDRVLVFESSGG